MKKSKSGTKSKGGIKEMLFGTLMIWGLFLLFSLIFAIILFSGEDPTGSTALFSIIAFVLSGALGTLLNRKLFARCDKNVPLISALISAIAYAVISVITSGKISVGALISALCFLGSAVLVSLPKKKKAKRHAR